MFSIDATEKKISRRNLTPIYCLEESHENLMMLRWDTFLGRFHGKLLKANPIGCSSLRPVEVESERALL